eukprot:4488359-Prymnesium_polylepis.1
MEAKCPGGSSGRSKKDGAEAWRRAICANLVKADVSLPCGAKVPSNTGGVLSVPYRPFSQGPYKEKDPARAQAYALCTLVKRMTPN